MCLGYRRSLVLWVISIGVAGCATIRVTDPYQTATEQFLESEATRLAVARIQTDQLRDRKVFVDPTYLSSVKEGSELISFKEVTKENLFLLAELRNKILISGARIVEKPEDADIIVEARTGGISVDHYEYLLGLNSFSVNVGVGASTPIETPEISILKTTKQLGFASVAYVAFWRDTGEVVESSGPFVGRTAREDHWILGFGPYTVGNIPPAEKPTAEGPTAPKK